MAIQKIYAQVNCSDLSASIEWYRKLFGRMPDARPMEGLAEWHHRNSSGFQLFENPRDAGHGTMTLIVDGLREEHSRLKEAGLVPGDIEPASSTSLVRLRDLDGNLIVLAEPGRI
jgi:hypothetical protein